MGGEAGYDGGKKAKGRKRHIVADALGLLIAVAVTAANCDDGTYAPEVLEKAEPGAFPRLKAVFADNKHANKTLDEWMRKNGVPYRIQAGMKPEGEPDFVPVRIRWVVEQGIACLNRCRRLSKDYEHNSCSGEAWVQIAAISRMSRRLDPDPNNGQAKLTYPMKERKAA